MAGYEVSVGKELLPGLLSGQDGLARLVEAVLNPKAQVEEALGAEGHGYLPCKHAHNALDLCNK